VPLVVRDGSACGLEQDFVQLERCEARRIGQVGKAAVRQFPRMIAAGLVIGAIADHLERFSHAKT